MLIALYLIGFLLFGCKRTERPTYYVDPVILPYVWFPAESYWIYQDTSSTPEFDSVYASNSSHHIVEIEGDNYISERYEMTLAVAGRFRHQTVYPMPVGEGRELVITHMTELYSQSMVIEQDYLLEFDPRRGDSTTTLSGFRQTHLDSLQVLGRTYRDVYQTRMAPPRRGDWNNYVAYAKDVGIIERHTVDGKVWRLVRHHINR